MASVKLSAFKNNTIEVIGSTQSKRQLASDVIEFCIEKLMPRMKTLYISVDLVDELQDDAVGYIDCIDSRQFDIEILNNVSIEEFITSICHEMVHVKQYARGETKDVNSFTKSWKGEEYIAAFSTVAEYMNFPWEKEAYGLQEELFQQFSNVSIN